ncbi:MAG: ABC transporter substrate-binding protein [Lachnospiraceae bacterium]|nr:ABC transporter substrate-binding protein [Lachnospiraceae bacterium]
MKQKHLKALLMVVLSLALTLTSCAGKRQGESTESQITIGIPQDVEDSLDPHKAVAAGTEEVFFNIFEGLVKPDSDGNLNPAVASDYKVSEDEKTYTFTLREGVKFHDGSLVTVEDVKYSIERCADTSEGGPLVAAFSNIVSVNAPDEKTIEIVLAEPDADFLASMDAAIIPASNTTPESAAIGTGPYKFVSHAPQESFVMEKFDEYWGEAAHIDKVTLKVCANTDTIVMNLNGGSIDLFARLTATQVSQLSDDFEVLEGTMNLVQALYLNNGVEPFNNEKVRQALCYAIDKQYILDMTSDGHGTPIGSSMFPAFGKYYMPELADYYSKDVEKAKGLLKEAGYPDGFSFTIKVPSNYTPHIETAQVIAEELKAINVDAKIELIEWETWLSDVYSGRKFEGTVIGLDASSLTASSMLLRFNSDSSKNFINYSNQEYDAAYARAVGTTDEEERTAAFKECQQILTETAANVYIQDMAEFVAINKKYAGYEFYPLYVQDYSKLYIVGEE